MLAELKIQDFVITHLQRDESKIRSWKQKWFPAQYAATSCSQLSFSAQLSSASLNGCRNTGDPLSTLPPLTEAVLEPVSFSPARKVRRLQIIMTKHFILPSSVQIFKCIWFAQLRSSLLWSWFIPSISISLCAPMDKKNYTFLIVLFLKNIFSWII